MIWILGGIAVAVLIGFFLLRARAPDTTITLDQISEVYESLKNTGKDGSFAVLIPPSDSNDSLNIQFSIEHGEIGLDWVLMSPVNIRDKGKFVALLDRERVRYSDRSMNGVDFLRTTDSRAPKVCRQVLEELYSVPSNTGVTLIVEGFKWGAS